VWHKDPLARKRVTPPTDDPAPIRAMYLTLCEDPVEAILNILLVAPITVRHLNDKELEMFDIPNVDSDVCIYDFRTADKDFDEVKVCLNDKLLDRSAKDKTETE
jgi:hypothetical protein